MDYDIVNSIYIYDGADGDLEERQFRVLNRYNTNPQGELANFLRTVKTFVRESLYAARSQQPSQQPLARMHHGTAHHAIYVGRWAIGREIVLTQRILKHLKNQKLRNPRICRNPRNIMKRDLIKRI